MFNLRRKKSKEIKLNNLIKRVIYNFYLNNNQKVLSTITNISFEDSKDNLKLVIETHRPGLIIGKQAKFVLSLVNSLKDVFEKKINVDVKQTNFWEFNN
jgi:ribosomal protein S3